jgi:alkanesulfonate monooxygenase SsuD/methylene tetrahydromethanopterin reductase-like flavin-dependent oxidoreductase (luciferase family)
MGDRRLRFGLISEQMRDDTLAGVSPARRRTSYSTFLLRNHFIADAFGPQFAPVPALMTIANRTTLLRIGSLSSTTTTAIRSAGAGGDAHLLSGGRFELGIGADGCA